jgi:hypothetical protein
MIIQSMPVGRKNNDGIIFGYCRITLSRARKEESWDLFSDTAG